MPVLRKRIEKLMELNHRTAGSFTYTIPSPEIYPFGWLWDACFHALILSKFDPERAKQEFRGAISKPLPWGLIPHIMYWDTPEPISNWGREMRGDIINAAWGVKNTSAITQPPIMAYAAWRIYLCDTDKRFLAEVYPALRTHYAYLLRERTLPGKYLVNLINPDESGEDNSPRFDAIQGLSAHHSADENLEKRILRMRQNAECQFEVRTCMSGLFSVADVSFNVILAESLGILARIAQETGYVQDVLYFTEQEKLVNESLRAELHLENGEFYSYDNVRKEHIRVKTWNLFMPLYGGLVTAKEADHIVTNILLNPDLFWTEYPVPSTAVSEPSFDPATGFWRGPVWIAPNWFLYHGLKRYHYEDVAEVIKQKTIDLIARSGFREHYNPLTGEGLGAHDFTWGGLVLDME